jgi:biopolymer transport protein ExbD
MAMVCFISIFIVLALAQGCADKPAKQSRAEKKRLGIELKPGGAILLDGKGIKSEELRNALQQRVKEGRREILDGKAYSLLEVVITAQRYITYEALDRVLEACGAVGIRRTWFSHPDIEKGEQIELWMRLASAPMLQISLQEVQIKLLWVERDNPRALRPAGEGPATMVLKVRDKVFLKDNLPDWENLEKLLVQRRETFKPTKSFKALPVIIRPVGEVPFVYVLRCVALCKKAGVGEIAFGALPSRK